MENQQPTKSSMLNNIFKITGILGIIVVSLSLLFYFAIFPYQKEQKKNEYEKRYNQARNECINEMKNEKGRGGLVNDFRALSITNNGSLEFFVDSCAKGKIN